MAKTRKQLKQYYEQTSWTPADDKQFEETYGSVFNKISEGLSQLARLLTGRRLDDNNDQYRDY